MALLLFKTPGPAEVDNPEEEAVDGEKGWTWMNLKMTLTTFKGEHSKIFPIRLVTLQPLKAHLRGGEKAGLAGEKA